MTDSQTLFEKYKQDFMTIVNNIIKEYKDTYIEITIRIPNDIIGNIIHDINNITFFTNIEKENLFMDTAKIIVNYMFNKIREIFTLDDSVKNIISTTILKSAQNLQFNEKL